MKRILITGISLVLVLSGMNHTLSRPRYTANFEKRIRCEDRCREQWWQCRMKAAARKDRHREKAMQICQTQSASCMERCRRYE